MIGLIEAAKNAKKCQRNWDYSRNIPDADIEKIIEICTTVPTKQNLEYYQLFVSKDLNFNQKITKDFAIDPREIQYYKDGIQNPQLSAPVTFFWLANSPGQIIHSSARITNTMKTNLRDKYNFQKDLHMNIGVSIGTAAFTANLLGYCTGFCSCILGEDAVEKEFIKFDKNLNNLKNKIICALGIGFPIDNVPHNQGYFKEQQVDKFSSNEKKIRVGKIGY